MWWIQRPRVSFCATFMNANEADWLEAAVCPTKWPELPVWTFFFLEMGGSALQIIPVIISAKDDCVRTITVRTLGQSWTRKSLCKLCRTLIWQFCFLVHVKLASLGFCFKSVWQSDFMISTRSPAINWVQPTKNNHFLNIRLISKGHHEMPKQSKAQWSSLGDDNEQLDHSELFCFYLFPPRSPPRPSPGSLHYSDEDVSTKYNDLIPAESSSLTEKPSEISDSQVQ